MFRRVLIASVCTTVLAVAAPATASSPGEVSASDRAAVPVKKVVRQYGDGPVPVKRGQELVLRFKGKRGDRVTLGIAYRVRSGKPYYGIVDERDVSVQGRLSSSEPDRTGYFLLAETGWFSVRYSSGYNEHVQLLKQVRVTHDGRGTTPLPQRRGYQYAVRVRAPQSGIRVVSFGTDLRGVVAKGRYGYNVDGQALVMARGLPVFDADTTDELTKPLGPREQVLVLVDPRDSGEVASSMPGDVGGVALDGPALSLPAGGTDAVVAELDAAEIAASAQRLLNVRLLGERARSDWGVLVLEPGGGVAEHSAPAYQQRYYGRPASLHQLAATAGTSRVLVFPTSRKARAGEFELESVADGGAIAVDGAAVTVGARADGRYTLLSITQPQPYAPSYLTVADVTVPGRWAVYAGRLTLPDCSDDSSLGCGEFNGVSPEGPGTGIGPLFGGHVLTMPVEDQTTGSFSVRLASTYAP